ncbi:uncharacterized protein LOC119672826 isoform X2 [Teleopsis dalmanni]|uniref:uncharacterized protein LOC119672826 isoform X2 n=1 Tax=Teleopsis dalmanni TaxID=139649 RepID=UPI0018CD4364|nr:uncharacterized protein LOC119672826 isoform X2 [Teleopsis dalmanni]
MATKIFSYEKELNQCRNVEKQKSQPQSITAKITNAYFAHTMQLAPRAQLTYILDHLHFPAFHVITSATNMSDETYKMRSPSYATTDAVVLELKRKTQIIKMLHVGSHHLDCRSFFYLALLVLIYCCVLISASTAARTVNGLDEAQGSSSNVLPGRTMIRTQLNDTHFSSSSTIPFSAVAAADFLNTSNITELSEPLNRHRLKRDVIHVPDDDDDSNYHDDEFDEYDALINNKSAKGKYIGAPCNNMKCEPRLLHVTCDKETLICGCEKNYPVQLGLTTGCAKPKKLGEQCFYDKTCKYNDENSLCVQVRHNALCECASGFHSVSYTKPTKRVFCTQDLKELTSDLPTLLGVSTGIAVLAGLICMVLHLFSKTKYPRHRNFGDANLPPPIMYSSDTGIPLTVQSGRPSSRSSLRSSGSIGSYGNRRASSAGATTAGSKGILVSTSRTGAARSAAILLISCHISALSKQNSQATSRQTSGAGCSANSRDNLDENGSDAGSRSCDSTLSMTRHLQKQLNHQRHLLSLELSPAKTKNHDRIRALLGINGIDNYRTDDDDLNNLENGNQHLQIGAVPTPASVTPKFAVNELDILFRLFC